MITHPLRRTKRERSADISLPPRLIQHRHVLFNQEEADYYTALYTQTQTQFNAFVQTGTVVNNYAHIFDLLIRLRQAVNHPWLVEHSATRMLGEGEAAAAAAGAAGAAAEEEAGGAVCAVCREEGLRPGQVIKKATHRQ
jgi:DNA repair protein RAD16